MKCNYISNQVKEYELSEVFHHSENALSDDILKMEHISYVYEEGEGNSLVLKQNLSAVPLSVRIEESLNSNSKPSPLAAGANQQSHQRASGAGDEAAGGNQEPASPFTEDGTTTTTASPASNVNNHQTSDSSIQQQPGSSSSGKKTRPGKFKKGHDLKKFRKFFFFLFSHFAFASDHL